jgi:hypothetical protein
MAFPFMMTVEIDKMLHVNIEIPEVSAKKG